MKTGSKETAVTVQQTDLHLFIHTGNYSRAESEEGEKTRSLFESRDELMIVHRPDVAWG